MISNGATLHLQPPAVERGSTEATSRKPHPRTDPLRRHTWSLWCMGSDRRWIRDASLKTLECESVNAPSEGAFVFRHSHQHLQGKCRFIHSTWNYGGGFVFISMHFSVQQRCTSFCRPSSHHDTLITYLGFGYLREDSNPCDTFLFLFCSTKTSQTPGFDKLMTCCFSRSFLFLLFSLSILHLVEFLSYCRPNVQCEINEKHSVFK